MSVDTLNILLADREAAKSQLAELALVHETLRTAHEALAKEHATRAANDEQAREPGLRSETTYLNIIGGLLTLLLGNSPSGAAYSSFRSMDAVVSALIAHHEGGRVSASGRCGASSRRRGATWRRRADDAASMMPMRRTAIAVAASAIAVISVTAVY